MFIDGIPVFANELLVKETVIIRKPRSKKRRIRKKWLKNRMVLSKNTNVFRHNKGL